MALTADRTCLYKSKHSPRRPGSVLCEKRWARLSVAICLFPQRAACQEEASRLPAIPDQEAFPRSLTETQEPFQLDLTSDYTGRVITCAGVNSSSERMPGRCSSQSVVR